MASEATWADAWRGAGHRETASWHFIDLELDGPNMASACFGFPPATHPASMGPANDCITDKLTEFEDELANPATPPEERLLALKYVFHFVGDVHQPLHASDNHDHGGNCVILALGGSRTVNLHSFSDTGGLAPLGPDPASAARSLIATITPAQIKTWSRGTVPDWAMESYQVARSTAYTVGSQPRCDSSAAPITPPAGYTEAAARAADLQLQKAGVRLAMVLNAAFKS